MAAALSAIKCRLKACKLWAMLLPFLTDYVRSLVLQPVLGHVRSAHFMTLYCIEFWSP